MKYIIDLPNEYKNDYVSVLENEFCYPIRTINKTYSIPTGLKIEPYSEPDRSVIEEEVWRDAWTMFLTPEDFGATIGDSYAEAKYKFEAWKKRKNEVHVGDEVIYHGNKYVVGYVGADEVYHIVDRNWIRTVVQGSYQILKTGRHFDEVEELLKKMEE